MKQIPDFQLFNIFTIGHGNRKAAEFLRLLKQYQIEVVADVRTFPYSRYNPQFRRKQLETELQNEGIEYLFVGNELGGRPSNPELYKGGKLDYSATKQTNLFKSGISHIVDLVRRNYKVTLMCSESNPDDCHRKHLLADEFIKKGLIIWHIDKAGDLEKHKSNSTPCLFD